MGDKTWWIIGNRALDCSRYLQSEPDLIDSAEFSPQHRPRYYWTNIPMAAYKPFMKDLQDVLTPNCNRHALVKKIRTVTTQLKSLKQGMRLFYSCSLVHLNLKVDVLQSLRAFLSWCILLLNNSRHASTLKFPQLQTCIAKTFINRFKSPEASDNGWRVRLLMDNRIGRDFWISTALYRR